MSTLISTIPQIVWVSDNKEIVFGFAVMMMSIAGMLAWRNRHAPCPVDPLLRDACLRTRRWSTRVYFLSVAFLAIGAWFAFIQPYLSA